MKFHVKTVLAVVVLVLAAVGAVFLFSSSEEQAIEKLLQGALEAAQKGDAEGVIAVVSKDYRRDSEDYAAVCERIRRTVSRPFAESLSMGGPALRVEGDRAGADLRVIVKAGPRELGDVGLHLELRKEAAGWRVSSAKEER